MNSKAIAAAIYASSLTPGCKILENQDANKIDPFRFELVEALHKRGLEVEPIPGGFVVVKRYELTPNWRACPTCGETWATCEHPGMLSFGEPTLPGGPCTRGQS